MRLYISGIKSLDDAQRAVRFGASAIGIKMGYGKFDVHPEMARDIFFSLPVFISRVGIFADEKRYNVQELVTFCRLDTLHFVGNEQPEDLERYPEHVIKTFQPQDMKKIQDYPMQNVVLNMDTRLSWKIDKELLMSRSLILSGLNTLTEWIDVVKRYDPYAVQLELSDCTGETTGHLLSIK